MSRHIKLIEPRGDAIYTRADRLKDAVVGVVAYLLVIGLATYLHHVSSLAATR